MTIDSARVKRRLKGEVRRLVAVGRTPISRINPEPLFVLGNQRSGTTAVAGLLAQATGMSVALDLTREVFAPTFDRVWAGEMSIDQHVRRNRFSYSKAIVKEPHLTPFLAELRNRFPSSRVAVVVRDPRDNIRSLFDYLEASGRDPDNALMRSPRVRRWKSWRLVVDGRWLGLDGERPLEQLAHRWNLCADAYLAHQRSVVLLRYEDFVVDRRNSIARLALSLGADLVDGDMAADDAHRAFQPRGSHRGARPEEFFGSENVAVIEQICATRMRALGYVSATR
jgi:hypothetical protein